MGGAAGSSGQASGNWIEAKSQAATDQSLTSPPNSTAFHCSYRTAARCPLPTAAAHSPDSCFFVAAGAEWAARIYLFSLVGIFPADAD